MNQFTKEELISHIKVRMSHRQTMIDSQYTNADFREYLRKEIATDEIALERLTAPPAPELKIAELVNKFYERYPLETFKSDTERSAALGYFMAGAELQCFGEFVNYADLAGDE